MHRLAGCLLCLMLAGCGESFVPVSASGHGAFEAALAVTGNGVAVAWYDNRHGNDEIYLRLLDADLRPLGNELRLTDNAPASYEADVAPLGADLAVAWYERYATGNLRVRLALWTPQGLPRWSKTLTAPGLDGRVPVLESVGDRLFIAWIEQARADSGADLTMSAATIIGAWFDASGAFLHPPFRIAPASRTTWNLNTGALPDGRIALVFDAEFETRSSELYLAVVDGSAVSLQRLSDDDGFASTYPDIAATADVVALSWQDAKDGNDEVYLTLFDPLAIPATGLIEREATRITHTRGESIGAYLAWNGPVLGLAWNDNDSGRHQLWFQSFDDSGRPLQPARRLTDTRTDSMIPAIVPLRSGFVLAWGEVSRGEGGHDGDMSSTRSEIVARYVE